MSTLEPKKGDEGTDGEGDDGPSEPTPDVLTIDDDETQDVLNSISSETALLILTSVHDSPKIPIDLADELGTTTQNVRYHLEKLENAGLVEVGDICYSEKGREMSVYQPSESPSALVFGKSDDGVRMRQVLGKVSMSVGPVAFVVVLAAKLKSLFEWGVE